MHLVDTHFHLDAEFFDFDRDEVVARARPGGVARIIVPAIKFENIPRVLAMTDHYEVVCGALNK